VAVVLRILKLHKSTYYSNLANRGQEKISPPGKPAPGYSFTRTGNKVCDEQIKEYLIKLVEEEGYAYGYRKLTWCLRKKYSLVINFKKVYRLCKELAILKPQRKVKPKEIKHIAINRTVIKSNSLWEIDIKYGYIHGEDKFFFILPIIDVFDRSIVEYYMGLKCEAKDVVTALKRALLKRDLFNAEDKPVIRTDNEPQFISNTFELDCQELGIHHERIPCRTPNKNAHIESFNKILEYECLHLYEFDSYTQAYRAVDSFMKHYNQVRIHSSLKYRTPDEFYILAKNKEVDGMVIRL